MRRLLRWVLRLFPRSFRDAYGKEIVEHLTQQSQETRRTRGRLAVAQMWGFQLLDLLRTAWSERTAERQAGPGLLRGTGQDAAFALRALRKRPAFTAVAVITAALGIGATTAMFNVLDAVVLHPLPYHRPDELVTVAHLAPGLEDPRLPQCAATFETYHDNNRVFQAFGAWARSRITITGDPAPEQVEAVWMTPDVFQVLGVRPLLGAPFHNTTLDEEAGRAVISYGFWQRHFGGDPEIIGKILRQENAAWEIVGVMPEDFTFLDTRPDVYLPSFMPEGPSPVAGKFDYEGIARLKRGVTLDAANRDVDRMIPLSVERFAWATEADLRSWRLRANVYPLADDVVGHVRSAVWILFGTFGIVLLVATANVANLFMVGVDARQHEIALRHAMGASRVRIVRQLLSESLLVGVLAGALGVPLARGATSLLVRLAPAGLPNAGRIGLDLPVFLFVAFVSVATGLLCGVLPALSYGSADLATSLKEGVRGGGAGRRRSHVRSALAVGEVGLALTLVIGSALMLKSFLALRAVHPGFESPEHVLTFRLAVSVLDNYRNPDATIAFAERVVGRVREIPGVLDASATSALPIEDRGERKPVLTEDAPDATDRPESLKRVKAVAPGYFRVMGIPVQAGRELTWDDTRERRPVVVVSEGLAREYWGSAVAALGRRVRLDPKDPWHEIVGVAGDVHEAGLQEPPPPMVYVAMATEGLEGLGAWVRRSMTYVVRTAGPDPTVVLPGVRRVVASLKPDVPVTEARTLGDLVAKSVARTTFMLTMLTIGAAVAVILGTVGVYGVVAHVFERRTREIGVRMALGADGLDVAWLVVKNAGGIAGPGVAVGLASAFGLSRMLTSLLFEVRPVDAATYLGASGLVILTVLLASYLPARRAASVDTVEALRAE
jgi:putative ABC transport system permease protein